MTDESPAIWIAEKLRPYRLLVIIYGAAAVIAVWEMGLASRFGEQLGERQNELLFDSEQDNLTDTLITLYPSNPDSEYMRGFQIAWESAGSRHEGPILEFSEAAAERAVVYFRRAMNDGVKHNEDLFYYYAIALQLTGADIAEVDAVVRKWRRNYPRSQRPWIMQYAEFEGQFGPTVAADQALSPFPWLDPNSIAVNPQSRRISFRIRDAVADIAAARQALRERGFSPLSRSSSSASAGEDNADNDSADAQ